MTSNEREILDLVFRLGTTCNKFNTAVDVNRCAQTKNEWSIYPNVNDCELCDLLELNKRITGVQDELIVAARAYAISRDV